ncbi:MAG: type 4a pilus biogenesis protein PilO [Candidatus Marinimicrobia bacterium]|nr:type 4a pilus biogenesis protein PilO [Candidatus Neomarinimicrobiota bacterium]MBL7022880.1 type 4a pilus biogenesis protein PilO [Candidatus Neomarinimicrobiota bacterium]MBL7109199.1 type 4a pilus biogenesis protein PilO [Candidatus Neomarinimicrobiota bacterium]
MKRSIYLFSILVLAMLSFKIIKSYGFDPKPDILMDLEDEQIKANEKLITAQILSESLNRVYTIFENNLATSSQDAVKKEESVIFLNHLTDILETLEIKTIHLAPDAKEKFRNHTKIPYELTIECSFDKFGKFITELERHNRIIVIDEYKVKNGIERISLASSPEELMEQIIEMKISTLTLNKHSG